MLINKITVGWVTQTFDTEQKKFIRQGFFASDHVDYEDTQGSPINSNLLIVDGEELYLPFDMVQPNIRFIELFDLDGQPRGILKTDADDQTLDNLMKEYSELENNDKGSDGFTDYCKKKYPDCIFELFFTDIERVLEI